MITLPKLSLYVHIPWCVQKCPYCDFNSHTLKQGISYSSYIDHLLRDLDADRLLTSGRSLHSIFIGGGTPSLFEPTFIAQLLTAIKQRIAINEQAEITMEANPGTIEASYFADYQRSGITRISLGIQSFSNKMLKRLGRIHTGQEAIFAAHLTKQLPLGSFNFDLMHGLPEQTLAEALFDLTQAITLAPPHLSWYQLTIEPQTLFASSPPQLPSDELLWQIYQQGHQQLIAAGYQQYETSAYAKEGYQCQHNLNYWRFGDYLGIGCGAHSKLTQVDGQIIRLVKTRHPQGYMQGNYRQQCHNVALADRPFEFFMNRFRLLEAVPRDQFTALTALPETAIRHILDQALMQGFIDETKQSWQVTERGKLFLNDLLMLFLPDINHKKC